MKIGQDDGHGNKVDGLTLYSTGEVTLKNMNEGDIIQIKNKEGCVISTSVVVMEK